MDLLKTAIGRLRIIGFLEGASFLLLLGIAMPLKYLAGRPEAVQIVGMAHGVLFLLYLLAAFQAMLEYDWSWRRAALIALASVVPFGPFYIDAKLLKSVRA